MSRAMSDILEEFVNDENLGSKVYVGKRNVV